MNAPPKEVEGQTTPHQGDRPSTDNIQADTTQTNRPQYIRRPRVYEQDTFPDLGLGVDDGSSVGS